MSYNFPYRRTNAEYFSLFAGAYFWATLLTLWLMLGGLREPRLFEFSWLEILQLGWKLWLSLWVLCLAISYVIYPYLGISARIEARQNNTKPLRKIATSKSFINILRGIIYLLFFAGIFWFYWSAYSSCGWTWSGYLWSVLHRHSYQPCYEKLYSVANYNIVGKILLLLLVTNFFNLIRIILYTPKIQAYSKQGLASYQFSFRRTNSEWLILFRRVYFWATLLTLWLMLGGVREPRLFEFSWLEILQLGWKLWLGIALVFFTFLYIIYPFIEHNFNSWAEDVDVKNPSPEVEKIANHFAKFDTKISQSKFLTNNIGSIFYLLFFAGIFWFYWSAYSSCGWTLSGFLWAVLHRHSYQPCYQGLILGDNFNTACKMLLLLALPQTFKILSFCACYLKTKIT